MSQTAQTGYLALAPQAAKGTAAAVDGSIALRVTSNTLSGNGEMMDFEEEIGGGRARESGQAVLSGFSVSGDVESLFRANAIGYFLLASGFTAAAPVQEMAGTVGTGAYTHTFTPAEVGTYLTILSRWGSTDAVRRFTDCLVNELTISLDANGKVTWSASIVGVREDYGVAGVTPTYETGPVANYAGSAVTLDSKSYGWESVELAIANNLSDDEFVIGSRMLDDVTFGAREVGVSGTIKVGRNDPSVTELYRKAVLGGATATTPGSSDPFHSAASVVFGSTRKIGTSAAKYFGLTATMPDLVLAGFPLEASGSDRLTVDLEGSALKGASPEVTIDLVNDKATAYAA